MKLVKLARDSATFLIRKRSPSLSQGKLVQCSGCERQKSGGGTCQDHTLSVIRTGNTFEPIPQERKCRDCNQPLAAWVNGDVCTTCLDEKVLAQAVTINRALMRQQMMQLYGALGQGGHPPPIQQFQNPHFRAFQAASMAGVNVWGYGADPVSREAAFRMEPQTVIGPILAYRSWRVRGGKLASLNGGFDNPTNPRIPKWQPREPMTGDVRTQGVYAHRLPAHIERDKKYVSGGVWLWGDVIEHEHGFRASFGYPAFLWLVDQKLDWEKPEEWASPYRNRLKSLAKMYEIPLFAVDSLENLPEREGLRERLLLP